MSGVRIPLEATPQELIMNPDTSRPQVQVLRETLKNRCTLLAAFILTAAGCYLLVGPPV
jgi:hypothetical protein